MRTTSPNNVRYHVDVLRLHGLLRAVRMRGQWRYFSADADVRRAERRLLWESDPHLRLLVGGLDPQGVHASTVVQRLRENPGLSRARAWRLVSRAARAGLVTCKRFGGRLVLRPVSLGSTPDRERALSAAETVPGA